MSEAAQPIDTSGYEAGDEMFAQPYIDVDEWRTEPVPHRYVHGGFTGTDTRFSYYFPPADQYEGRFFQHVTPVPISEMLAQQLPAGRFNKIGFSADSGAYFVETNGGGSIDIAGGGGATMPDPTITAYRANAAAAQFSRTVAQQVYDTDQRPYGYIYGGSGGAYRTVGSLESTEGVWDGGVPYVPGSTMAIPNMFTVRIQAMRVLGDKLADVTDAVEPGGSGDPYAGLDAREAEVLREIDKFGFPLPSFFGYETMGIHGFAALYPGVRMADGSYFTDFWTKPGYLGHDHPEYFTGARMQFTAPVAEVITVAKAMQMGLNLDVSGGGDKAVEEDEGGVDNAFEATLGTAGDRIVGYRLASAPPKITFIGGDLNVGTGASAGKTMPAARIVGDIVMLGFADETAMQGVQPGDEVTVDNSNFLAMESYHRHQVPGPDFPVWEQFRNADGTPIYPQRPFLVGPLFTRNTTASGMTGEVDEKVIVVASLWDREALPWQAAWYRDKVAEYAGEDADNRVRLYYTDHALHGDQPDNEDANRIVSYTGMLQQALRDVAAWAEQGIAPPASTSYAIDDGQVLVPGNAAERQGIQPVVTLTVNGTDHYEAEAGDVIAFAGSIAAPPGTGKIVAAEWDFTGDGEFTLSEEIRESSESLDVAAQHRFDEPGTYFVALRGVSQRQGDMASPYARLENLGRVRVVVK